MRNRYVVLVDAGYLLASMAGVLSGSSNRNMIQVNWEKLVQQMKQSIDALQQAQSKGSELLRVQWYDSPPEDYSGKRQAEEAFLSIDAISRTKTRIGRTSFGAQKGVDVKLALDIVHMAMRGLVTDLYLVSGDDDLTEAVEIAQDYGVRVHLFNVGALEDSAYKGSFGMHSTSKNLARKVDERHIIPVDLIKRAATLAPRSLEDEEEAETRRITAAAQIAAASAPKDEGDTPCTPDGTGKPCPEEDEQKDEQGSAQDAASPSKAAKQPKPVGPAAVAAAMASKNTPDPAPESAPAAKAADLASVEAALDAAASAKQAAHSPGGKQTAPGAAASAAHAQPQPGGKGAQNPGPAQSAIPAQNAGSAQNPGPASSSRASASPSGGEAGAPREKKAPAAPPVPSGIPVRRTEVTFRKPEPGTSFADYERIAAEHTLKAITTVVRRTVSGLDKVGRIESIMRRYQRPNIPADIDRALLIDICLFLDEPDKDIPSSDRERMRAVFWDEIEALAPKDENE